MLPLGGICSPLTSLAQYGSTFTRFSDWLSSSFNLARTTSICFLKRFTWAANRFWRCSLAISGGSKTRVLLPPASVPTSPPTCR